MVPNGTGSHCILHTMYLQLKRNPVSLKKILDEAVKVTLLSLDHLSTYFLTFCRTKWEVCIKHFCCIMKYDDYLKEKYS